MQIAPWVGEAPAQMRVGAALLCGVFELPKRMEKESKLYLLTFVLMTVGGWAP